jgi:hypothetical protein
MSGLLQFYDRVDLGGNWKMFGIPDVKKPLNKLRGFVKQHLVIYQ